MRAIICDKCDKILPPNGSYKEVFRPFDCGECEYHLCLDCVERLREWLDVRDRE